MSIKNLDDLKNLIKHDKEYSINAFKEVLEYYNYKLKNNKITCMYHPGDNDPSMSLTYKNGYAYLHCFGCGEHIDIFQFVQDRENIEFIEACKKICSILNIDFDFNSKSNLIGLRLKSKKFTAEVEGELMKKFEGNIDKAFTESMHLDKVKNNEIELYGNYKYDNNQATLYQVKPSKKENEEDTYIPIYGGYINISDAFVYLDDDKHMLNIISVRNNKVAYREISKGELTGKSVSYVTEYLNNTLGFSINRTKSKEVVEYLGHQFEGLENDNCINTVYKTSKIGFYKNNKYDIDTFVYPLKNKSLDNEIFYSQLDEDCIDFSNIFEQKGKINEYIDKVIKNLVKTKLGCISLSSIIASLLLEPLNIHELFTIDICGKNGQGKTILLFALGSIFGNHRKYVKEWSSTQNAIIGISSDLNNFPILLDDTKKRADDDIITNIIYAHSGGQEKGRSNIQGKVKQSKTFKNILISTGETSLLNYVKGNSSGAGAFGRVLTLDTEDYPAFIDKDTADIVQKAITENHGTFGYELCKWLVEYLQEENTLDSLKSNFEIYNRLYYNKVSSHASIRKAKEVALLKVGADVLNDFFAFSDIDITIDTEIFDELLLKADEFSKEHDIYKTSFDAVIEYCITHANRLYSANIFTSGDEYSVPTNCIGWVKDDIYNISDTNLVSNILNEYGDLNDILKEWRKRGYINTDSNRLQKSTRTPYLIDGKKKLIRLYQLNGKFYNNVDEMTE